MEIESGGNGNLQHPIAFDISVPLPSHLVGSLEQASPAGRAPTYGQNDEYHHKV